MGSVFTFLTIRIAFIMIGIATFSMVTATTITGTQPLFDPFAPYADMMPGQPPEKVMSRGFHCEFNGPPSYYKFCSLNMEIGIFSEIQVTITNKIGRTSRVSKIVFIPRENRILLGHLAHLWGKPQTHIIGKIANFRWLDKRVVTVLQNYNGHLSYLLPITYIAFESTN